MAKPTPEQLVELAVNKIRTEGLLQEAHEEGGDYWNSIELDGVVYDINLWDSEGEYPYWKLSIYPLNWDGRYWSIDCSNPIIEGVALLDYLLNGGLYVEE